MNKKLTFKNVITIKQNNTKTSTEETSILFKKRV